ncbi:acetylxylan esterase [Propionibacteriaceae bacterium Y2011]
MDINAFLRSLAETREAAGPGGPDTGSDMGRWQEEQRTRLWQRWGLAHRRDERKNPPRWVVTGTVEGPGTDRDAAHTIELGWFEASPGLVITANLYRPRADLASGAAMLYVCGHSPTQKIQYQDHARRLAQLGFTTLIMDTVEYGEVPGVHRGTHREGAFNWISRGYSPVAAEGWTAVRGFDLLAGLDEVDPDRIGITGHSGGGAVSWWAATLEPRIRAVVSSTGTVGEVSHVTHRTIDVHCDCYFPVNPLGESIASVYALVAPRPMLVLAPRFDLYCEYESVVSVTDRLVDWYAAGTGNQWPLEVFGFDAGHSYSPESRRRAFGWLTRHVRDVDTIATDAGPDGTAEPEGTVEPADIDGVRLAGDQLRVFGTQPPPDGAANATLQDWLTPARPPAPADPERLAAEIRETCFGFTSLTADTRPRISRRLRRQSDEVFNFTFEPEPGWPLEAVLNRPEGTKPTADTTVFLLDRASHRPFLNPSVPDAGAVPLLTLAVRGTGRTTWHPQADWHLRRAAAMLGRPFGAMRVLDVLRGLQAHRALFGTVPLTLVARREMAFPALLAALLDPAVTALRLAGLPRSIDLRDDDAEQSDEDGTYLPQAEVSMLLRIADVDDILRAVRTRATVELS